MIVCFLLLLVEIIFQQIYRHLPDENGSNLDENVSRGDLKHAVINLIDSEVSANFSNNYLGYLHCKHNAVRRCWVVKHRRNSRS